MRVSSRDIASLLLLSAGVAALAFAALKPRSAYHPVTAAMSTAADASSGLPAPTLEAEGTDGRRYSPWSDARERPLVLFFIQDGCPCSEAAEPYFQRLHAAHGRDVAFLGVIDGDLKTARDWARGHETPYPILADPGRSLITACRAERSAYVMLVGPGGRIEALWPGYSSGMLVEVGARLARLTRRGEVSLDTRGAPEELASGCSY